MASSSHLVMLNIQSPTKKRAKRAKLAKAMVSWVQLPEAKG